MTDNPNKNTAPAPAANPVNKIQVVKSAPPPPQLPILGKVDAAQVSFIGQTNYVAALEEKKFVFGIKRADREHHLFVIGRPHVGKSKLLELLIRQDIAVGAGLCVIDPYGDVVEAILDFVPEKRIEDTLVIDLSTPQVMHSFNPFEGVGLQNRYEFAEGMIDSLERYFGKDWNPRLEHLLRFSIIALTDYPGATLSHLVELLTDAEFRKRVISHGTDSVVNRFWIIEFPDWLSKFEADAVIPLVGKLRSLFSSQIVRTFLGKSKGTVRFSQCIAEKKIVLCKIDKRVIGEEGTGFIGALLLASLRQAAAVERTKERDPFYLYIDDFHFFAAKTIDTLLTEGRRYGIALTLATQYLDQLPEKAILSILSSAGSLVVFRVGGRDAERLEVEMAPVFKAKDMINLAKQEFYIKLMIDGEVYDPFSARVLKVLKTDYPSSRERILGRSVNKTSLRESTHSL